MRPTQSIAAQPERAERGGAAEASGFSLHAGLDIQPGELPKLERLCRYVSRPPVATERLALMPSGQVRYQPKTPCRDGTTHIVLEPLDLSWAQRLRRVFAIEIDTCARCQGRLRVIASLEETEVIARVLAHRERDQGAAEPELAPIAARAPPRQGRLL